MNLKFLADEDFNGRILRGLIRRRPDIIFTRVQDIGRMGQPDSKILAWAAENGYVLLTHDINTMVQEAVSRLAQNLPLAGIILVPQNMSIGQAIEDLIIFHTYVTITEFEGNIQFLPL